MPDTRELELLKAFHGHLGPYVVAGLRVGRAGLQGVEADPHFGLDTEVWCPGAPPPSCFLYGIQFSTGCTLGKQNIRHHVDPDVRARFTNRHTKAVLTLRLRPEAIAEAVRLMQAGRDVDGAAYIESLSEDQLFEVVSDS
jgi:formylmethanofuran dehydrogenase subunit E